MSKLNDLLVSIASERARQNERWGEQNHPDIMHSAVVEEMIGESIPLDVLCKAYGLPTEQLARAACDAAKSIGKLTWSHIAVEELCEVVCAPDDEARVTELVQLAAVCVAWAEAIKRRGGK